jgi:hypothetical protein
MSIFIFTIVGLIINGIGIIFVAAQVALGRRQIEQGEVKSESERVRAKKQATIDFYMSTVRQVNHWREILPDDWDDSAINSMVETAYSFRDRIILLRIAEYLGFFEALATAVRHDVYDIEVLASIAGSRILNIAQGYHPFFVRRRIEVGTSLAYEHLEWLASQISRLPSYASKTN